MKAPVSLKMKMALSILFLLWSALRSFENMLYAAYENEYEDMP